jgi:nicotinamidase-related amidase
MKLDLDAATTALVLIDLQKGIVGRPLVPHAPADVVKRAAALAAALRAKGGLVVYVHVLVNETNRLPVDTPQPRPAEPVPAEMWAVVPEAGRQPADILVAKRSWGAFYGTDLELHLRRHGIRTLIMAGIATNIGVESTARAAFDHGYALVFAEDAMTTVTAEMHAFAVQTIFPRMGRVRSAAEIVAALA